MAQDERDAAQDERMYEAFDEMGEGARLLRQAWDGKANHEDVRRSNDFLSSQSEVERFLVSRGLTHLSQLDEEGRKKLLEEMRQTKDRLFHERGWNFSDEPPVLS